MIRQESERGVRADAAVQPAGDAAQAEEIAARNIRNLVLQTALAGVVNGGIGTFLAVYLTRLGASPLALSLLTALPALLTIAVALPAGAIAARYTQPVRQSTRHFLLIRLCYLLVAAAAFLPAEAAIWTVVVIWTLTAIPGAIANTAWMDVFAEAIPARERAHQRLALGAPGFHYCLQRCAVRTDARPAAISIELPARVPDLVRRRASQRVVLLALDRSCPADPFSGRGYRPVARPYPRGALSPA